MRGLAAVAVAAALALPSAAAAADPLRARQWGLDMVEATAAQRTASGEDAVVAVVDSGVVAGHPDLEGRLLPGRDFVDGDSRPEDGDGHGTHMTGIVAALSGNGIGVESVAPGAMVLPVRVLDDRGEGFAGDTADGIDYAVAQGADVINLSLGASAPLIGASDGEVSRAVERAVERGVVVVAASGNNGLPICENPSADGRVLCVGAVDRHGRRSSFSSFGAGLSLVAPGGSGSGEPDENILSTYTRPAYEELAGTSPATPHVSGVAALLVSLGVRGQAAVRRILGTASDRGSPGPDAEYGAGIVNARAAVAGLGRRAPGAPDAPAEAPADDRGAAGTGSAAGASLRRVHRLRTVLRRGIRVRCRAARAGHCRVTSGGKGRRRIASGSRRLAAGRSGVVRVRLTRRGRRLALRRARRAGSQRLRLRIAVPGGRPLRRTVVLRR